MRSVVHVEELTWSESSSPAMTENTATIQSPVSSMCVQPNYSLVAAIHRLIPLAQPIMLTLHSYVAVLLHRIE